MGNCISAHRTHDPQVHLWGEDLSIKGSSRTGLGPCSQAALLHQGSRNGVQLLLRRTSFAPPAHQSPPPLPLMAAEPCTPRCSNTGFAGAKEMLYRQASNSSSCKPFAGSPFEESQVLKASPTSSPFCHQPTRKNSPHPLALPVADFPEAFPEACVNGTPRRSSASAHSSPLKLLAQHYTPPACNGSLPLSPDSIMPPQLVLSPQSPKDDKASALLHSVFPRDSALSVSVPSPHSSKPMAATLTPSHSLGTHSTAHTLCPPAAHLTHANSRPAEALKSTSFSRTPQRQPISKPFTLQPPNFSPPLAQDAAAPITQQGSTAANAPHVNAELRLEHAREAQHKQPSTPNRSAKDVRGCEELCMGPTSVAVPHSPCSKEGMRDCIHLKQASPTHILPSPFTQQWLDEGEAEGLHEISGISNENFSSNELPEARDAFADGEQQWGAHAHHSQGCAPPFVSSTVRHTSAGSYHRGLHSAQHSLRQQASHEIPCSGADDWASMHMAMAVAAELGEDIPTSHMEVVAVIAEAEARASSSGMPLSYCNTTPGTNPGLKRNMSTGSSQMVSRTASSTLQADFPCSTSSAFAQAPTFDAPPYGGLRHCCSDRVSPHSSAGGRHSCPSHPGSSRISHPGSSRTTPGSRNSRNSNGSSRSSSMRRSPAGTLAQLGNFATRPSIASSTTTAKADAVTGLTHAFTRRSQRGSVDSTILYGPDNAAASERALKVLDTTPWTKDPNAPIITNPRTSSPRGPHPIPRRPSFPLFFPSNKPPSPAAHRNTMDVASAQKWGRPLLPRSSRSSCPSGAADVSAAVALLAPPVRTRALEAAQQQQKQQQELQQGLEGGCSPRGDRGKWDLKLGRGSCSSGLREGLSGRDLASLPLSSQGGARRRAVGSLMLPQAYQSESPSISHDPGRSSLAKELHGSAPVVAEGVMNATGAINSSPTSPLKGLLPPWGNRFRTRQMSLPPVFQHKEAERHSDGMHALPNLGLSPTSRPTPTSVPSFHCASEGHCQQQQLQQLHQGEPGDARAHANAPGGMAGRGGRGALTHTSSMSQLMVGQPCGGGPVDGTSPPQYARDEHELVALQGFFSPRAAARKNSQCLAIVPESLDNSFDSSRSDEVANL